MQLMARGSICVHACTNAAARPIAVNASAENGLCCGWESVSDGPADDAVGLSRIHPFSHTYACVCMCLHECILTRSSHANSSRRPMFRQLFVSHPFFGSSHSAKVYNHPVPRNQLAVCSIYRWTTKHTTWYCVVDTVANEDNGLEQYAVRLLPSPSRLGSGVASIFVSFKMRSSLSRCRFQLCFCDG